VKLSVRNQLKGKIIAVKKGATTAHVRIDIGRQTITASITNESAEEKIHPHMLRHSGYKLANDGVDTRTIQSYLGHKSIQHTVRYTELAPTRFKSLFRD
jgi:molybdopterin-binding protein